MKNDNKPTCAQFSLTLVATVVAMVTLPAAHAAEIDTGNPDLKLRWDNTVRYNLGVRTERQDARLLASPSYDESDAKFGRGDIVTNRLDLFSELDLSYKQRIGVRVSAAGWYDDAYSNRSVSAPGAGGAFQTSYFNDQYNNTVKRYVNGPSAEVLDAFVWGNFNLGDVPVNVKLGRHALVWGEGILLGAHAISYSQQPTDGVKAVTSPGIETKELVLPLGQLSFKAQVASNLSLFGQYFYEWKPTRAPNGGTYLAGADTAPNVDRLPVAAGASLLRTDANAPKQRGNWGVGARFNAEAIESTLGAYYRRFNDYAPEVGLQLMAPTGPFRFNYAKDVELYGLSFARGIGPVTFGTDVSYRRNGPLNSRSTYVYSPTQDSGARGDTLHVVANGIYLLPKTALWDTGSLVAEVAYSRLQKITANESLYKGVGYASCIRAGTTATPGDKSDGCSTRDFVQLAVSFTPQYLNLLPSWDLDLPFFINYGVHGTAPSGSGGFEKLLTWSIGAKMTYAQRYEFSLRYADVKVPTKYNAAGTMAIGGNGSGSSIGNTDRGWLAFTFKTSF